MNDENFNDVTEDDTDLHRMIWLQSIDCYLYGYSHWQDQKKIGVIAASAGNHALALSYHGQCLDIPVTVVMPLIAPMMKVQACRSYGANVIIQGNDISEVMGECYHMSGFLKSCLKTIIAKTNLISIRWFVKRRYNWIIVIISYLMLMFCFTVQSICTKNG